MSEWSQMDTAPSSGLIALAVEAPSGQRKTFAAEASFNDDGELEWMVTNGWVGWHHIYPQWTPICWRHLPVAP